MTLQFTQAGSAWACEFEVTDKINLRIENAEGILLYQRTAAGKFALITDAPTSTGPVFDYDLEGLVYPKHIRVICSSLPTYAEVVSDGEITEIKSQSKEVEITANGTTQVAPDAGFSYLTGVTVKTNVPQSGGSGEGGTESSWRYLDVTNVSKTLLNSYLIGYAATLVVAQGGQTHIISPFGVGGASEGVEIKAMSVNMRTRVKSSATSFVLMAYEDIFKQEENGITGWDIIFTNNGATEITEEEFYNLES